MPALVGTGMQSRRGEMERGRAKVRNTRETERWRMAHLVQRLVVDARTEHRGGHESTFRL